MMGLKEAKKAAKAYYQSHGELEITEIYDAERLWIFFGQKDERVLFGSTGISIDKETGEIADFYLPSDENFEILEHAKLVTGDEELTEAAAGIK